jgi:hypothetical protein
MPPTSLGGEQRHDKEHDMAKNILEVFGQDKKQPMATLSIGTYKGTNAEGFGWDWLGAGHNTGGKWFWLWNNAHYSIGLRTTNDKIFGFVNADWSTVPSPTAYPPEPWFSLLSPRASSGSLDLKVDNLPKSATWRLRRIKP